MATFVLVHGAWHGGWCWWKVRPLLQAAGHTVYTPTLTGLGERIHLARPEVGLATHIDDVVNVIEFEGLRAIILVGHSYGGMVIMGVAGQVPAAIRRLVFLDAFMPNHGQCAFDFLPGARPQFEAAADQAGDGWQVPPLSPAALGITDEADIAWMDERLTPMPLLTHEEPVQIPNPTAYLLPRTFIRCTRFEAFGGVAQQAQAAGWDYHELDSGHDAMITAPEALTALLLRRTED
jgi:pimeloyl-ACP methyl ester carboxylesterase